MNENEWLAKPFEENRAHLRAVAYRMLGSLSEADDAVQETWLRLTRSNAGDIENLGGWLTTVISRVCLDMLRSRKSRREEPLDASVPEPAAGNAHGADPEQEAVLADSVGLALLVVLDRLNPAERLAFVLHDMFALPFEEIAGILGRSAEATRQLASRARRRVQGADSAAGPDLVQQREVVDSFLAAVRVGDVEALVSLLDPDMVFRADKAAVAPGAPTEVRGAWNWARQAVAFSRGARFAAPALINGAVGLVLAPRGRLLRALTMEIEKGKITRVNVLAEPSSLGALDLALLNN